MYDYQKDAVREMLEGKVLNTSKVGTGKTLMAMGCIEALGAKSSIVLAPKSLLLQWRGEIEKFLGYQVFVASGLPKKRIETYTAFSVQDVPSILITNYESYRMDYGYLSKIVFDVAVYDEAHKLKEPNTILKKRLKFLIARHRFGLTGSPVVNHYGNTYNVLATLKPSLFPNYYAFVNRFGIKTQAKGLLIFRDQETIRQMFAPHIVSKTLEDAGKSLPPLQEIELPIELSDKERKIYDKMLMEMIFDFEHEDVSKLSSPIMLQNTLAKIGKLQECADHLSLIGDHNDSSKLDALRELLDSQIEPSEQVLIFTRFSRMADILEKELGALKITGATNNRDEVIRKFKEGARILVGTNAMREGLNLQEASVVVMYDQDYTAAGMEQRIGRAHRLGQEKRVRVYHLLAYGTIDYKIKRLLVKKQSLADDLMATIKELLNDNSV